MEKKWKLKWKTAPSWTGAKMAKKWPKNGKIMENSLKNPFLGHFFAIFAPVQLGAVFHFDFHFFFFHFRLLAVFHAIPAQQEKRPMNLNLFGWWPSGGGQSPGRVSRGQRFSEPKDINLFIRIPDREGRWPGWPDRLLGAKLLCAFLLPTLTPDFEKVEKCQKRLRNVETRLFLTQFRLFFDLFLGCLQKEWNRQGVRNHCTRNSRNNAIVLRPVRAIASHVLLHKLLRQQTTIAATPLAESTPLPNSQFPIPRPRGPGNLFFNFLGCRA